MQGSGFTHHRQGLGPGLGQGLGQGLAGGGGGGYASASSGRNSNMEGVVVAQAFNAGNEKE